MSARVDRQQVTSSSFQALEPVSLERRSLPAIPQVTVNHGPAKGPGEATTLWGRGLFQKFDFVAFLSAPPAERKERLSALSQEKGALSQRITQRAEQLSARFDALPPEEQQKALELYRQRSAKLGGPRGRKLDEQLRRADGARKLGGELEAKLKNAKTPAERRKLLAELKTAKAEQERALSDAKKDVDDAGLKLDRLATTEAVVDPGGASGGFSLWSLMERFGWVATCIEVMTAPELNLTQVRAKDMKKDADADVLAEIIQKKVQKLDLLQSFVQAQAIAPKPVKDGFAGR